jgi:alkylation response protein AidB-like acyl-CoA dehydrogenase
MDFTLTEDQQMMKDAAREFSEKRVRPHAEEFDKKQAIPPELLQEAADLGYMGLLIPEAYGGLGVDTVSYVCVMEEFARVSASLEIVISVHNSLVSHAVASFASEAIKKKYLPRLAAGTIGAYCLSEPGSGTDAGSLITTAPRDGDAYVVNGTKNWVTNAGIAGIFLVFVKTNPEAGPKGISCLLVEAGQEGMTLGKPEDKLGIKSSDTREVAFTDARIPVDRVVGEENRGFPVALAILDSGRIGVAAQAVGIAQGAFEEAVKYSQEREQFNQPLANFQAIQFKIADMAMKIDAARLLTYRAAYLRDQPDIRPSKEISIAKLFASEISNWVANEAVQIHGGYGYIKEYPVERYFRDARITEIYEGTSEAQRMVISRAVLGRK